MNISGIHFVITGGTIDSIYDGTKGTVVPSEKSSLPAYIQTLRLHHSVSFSEVVLKDSRELLPSDLKAVKATIDQSPHDTFIITHGTYTMVATATYLQAHLSRRDVRVILTGSLTPLRGFCSSDAGFNLGFALAEATHMEPGVLVAMNGALFHPAGVIKLKSTGRFVPTSPRDGEAAA